MLEGKRIKKARLMTEPEINDLGWETPETSRPTVIELDDGTLIIPASNPELNGPGHVLIRDAASMRYYSV